MNKSFKHYSGRLGELGVAGPDTMQSVFTDLL